MEINTRFKFNNIMEYKYKNIEGRNYKFSAWNKKQKYFIK